MSVSVVWQDLFSVVTSFSILGMAIWLLPWCRDGRLPTFPSHAGARAFAAALTLVVPQTLPEWMMFSRGGAVALLLSCITAIACAVAAVLLFYGLLSSVPGGDHERRSDEPPADRQLLLELDDTRRRLRELTEVGGDWVWQSDARGVLTSVSEGVRSVLGVGPEALVGRKLIEIGIAEEGAGDFESVQSLLARYSVFRNLPLKLHHANGDVRQMLLGGSPRFDSYGAFCGYTGLASDMTAETRLREARASAQAKDTFFASMSHEIRTPLNGVLGVLDILKDTQLDEDQQRLVATATDSSESLLHLISDILDLSKLEAGRFEVMPQQADLARSITMAVDTMQPLADKANTTLTVEGLAGIPPLLEYDPHRYRQILLNFVGNAIKFTKNGRIVVSIEAMTRTADGIALRTAVTDTGPGIAPAQQKLLFMEFSQLHDPNGLNAHGTGLGLAVSRGLAKAMGGDVGVVSAIGQGSTFWFEIPFGTCQAAAGSEAQSPAVIPVAKPAGTKTVLLAEDNPTNVLVATRILEAEGHLIVHAADGRQAVELFKRQTFDAVLMDISMPVLDGISAAREIRGLEAELSRSPTPIIALTAHASASERRNILAAGMTGFLSKPVRKSELIDELAKHARRTPASGNDAAATPAPAMRTSAACAPMPSVARTPSGRPARDNRVAHSRDPLLDSEMFRQLGRDTGEDNLPALVEVFVQEVRKRAAELERARRERDVTLLERTCHAMSGSAATLGARRLHTISKRVEDACKRRPDVKYLEIVDVLLREIDDLVTHLIEPSFLARNTAPDGNEPSAQPGVLKTGHVAAPV